MATLILNPDAPHARLVELESSMLVGNSENCDIRLSDPSVQPAHARIEQKPDGFYLISLTHPPAVFINGKEVTFQRLSPGDAVRIGDIEATFEQEVNDGFMEEGPDTGTTAGAHFQQPMGTALAVTQRVIMCPHCGLQLAPGTQACPQCGMAISNLPTMPMGYIPPTPMGQSGAGILPIIAFLGALTVVGAPVALVLGLMTMGIIRRRGGTARDHRMAQWSIGLGLLWIMAGLLVLGGAIWKGHRQRQLTQADVNEAKVIRALKNLACAQKYTHAIEFIDSDGDGNSEYAELDRLTETKSPFFDADLADGEAYGYRFTMREASEGRFLAVAEPLHYGRTGTRTFAIDQTGQISGVDAEGRLYGQLTTALPVILGERSAYYQIDDEIAKDVLNYAQSLSASAEDQELKKRILTRLRSDFALTKTGRELEGMEESVDRAVAENRAQVLYWEAREALAEEEKDVALAKLQEIVDQYPSYSKIASVERELAAVRSTIAQEREAAAEELLAKAEKLERDGGEPLEVQQLYQQIEKLYPDTEVAERIAELKPELKRQLREGRAQEIFSDMMELSPETDYELILSQANQFRRNYSDTDLYAKVEKELNDKERSARAYSWRFRTERSIAEGRMRGGLAELESAIRENPDLQYDLRDLCTQLYRSAADKLLEEGDARGALTYYSRLDRVLKLSESGETVDPKLLASLHYKVGQADYESGKYEAARWHLDSAAWNYPDDAQFHMRLGVARMYSGLYSSADTALEQALKIEPDRDQALLYRAYLNLRTVEACDHVIADALKLYDGESDEPTPKEDKKGSQGDYSPAYLQTEEMLFSADLPGQISAVAVVPDPSDLDLVIRFDADTSSKLLSDLLVLLQQLQESFEKSAKKAASASNTEARNAAKLESMVMITNFRNELSNLRALHKDDIEAQKQLRTAVADMQKRVVSAVVDIQQVSRRQPRINDLGDRILPRIKAKAYELDAISKMLSENLSKEIELRELIFNLADRTLRETTTSNTGQIEIPDRIQTRLGNPDSIADIGQVLAMIKRSMDEEMEIDDLLSSAEGDAVGTGR